MRYTVLLLLLTSGCTWADVTPDSFTLGASRSENNFERLGMAWHPDRLHNIAGGNVETLSGFLTWNFGTQRPKPDGYWTHLNQAMNKMALEIAKVMPKAAGTTVNVNSKADPESDPKSVKGKDPKVSPETEPEHDHGVIGWLEWYGQASLWVQCFIAGLVLSLLVTMIMMRKTIVQGLRMAAFWRAKKAPKNGDEEKKPKKPGK